MKNILMGMLAAVMLFIAAAFLLWGIKYSKKNEISVAQLYEQETKEQKQIKIVSETENITETEAETAAQEVKNEIHLVFSGDIYLSDHVLNAYKRTGNITGVVDEDLLKEIHEADYFIANEEFPFSNAGQAAKDKQFTFRVAPEKVSMLNEMGVDLVALANNHALDYGREALKDTFATLDHAGIHYMGAGNNIEEASRLQTVELNGKRIGFLAASRVIPTADWTASKDQAGLFTTYDPALLIKKIKEARESCDYIVVYVHWGIEREERPQEYQRQLGKQYIDAGADLVIGSHPHVLQGVEYYQGKPIVYSLGNFVFGSSIPRTALLKTVLSQEDGKLIMKQLQFIPAVSSAGYTSLVKDDAKKQEFYQYMTGISFGASCMEDGTVISAGD